MKPIVYNLCALIALLLLNACKIRKTPPAELPEKTAFYTIEATRDIVKQLTSFRVLKVTVVDTKINYHPDEAKTKSRDYLAIEVASAHKPVILAYSEHPLYKKFDLYEETGEITSKLISLPKGQITVRLPYYEDYTTIRITETINFKATKPILLRHEK